MESVIVTVKHQSRTGSKDLELPVDVPVKELANMIAYALHWDSNVTGRVSIYHIHADPPGRLLEPDETLEDAGVWDGSIITFL